MEALPSVNKAAALRALWTIRHYGVTGILPGRVRFNESDSFIAFAPQKHFTARRDDGVFIHGFWKKVRSLDFYIYKFGKVAEGKNPETGDYYFLLPDYTDIPRYFTEYQPIDEDWIDDAEKVPFIRQAAEGLNNTQKVADSGPAYLEKAAFYETIGNFLQTERIAREHGSEPAWTKDLADNRVERITLDRQTKKTAGGLSLDRIIQSQVDRPNHLVLVQFIDEQDILHKAQDEFLNMMAHYLTEDYTKLKITILDVVVRDERGMTAYMEDFRQHHGTNSLGPGGSRCNGAPFPFVMVFGQPTREARDYLTNRETAPDKRLLEFDLFYGCRHAATDREANTLYQKNFRRSVHGVMRAAGLVANSSRGFHKDFRGFSEEEQDLAQWHLERNNVVLKVHGKQGRAFRAARQAYYNLKLTGCPYVTVLLADGPEDIVEIHDDTEHYLEYSGEVTQDKEFYAALEQGAREKYENHRLDGARPAKLHLPLCPETVVQ